MYETKWLNLHWNEMTETYKKLSDLTGISCPTECSSCCREHLPAVTVFEMLPAAQKIYNQGLMEEIIDRIEKHSQSHCVLIKGNLCQYYDLRPSLCRLFGLGRIENKNINELSSSFSICKVLKNNHPEKIKELNKNENLKKIKTFRELHSPILAQIPLAESDELPINEALKNALQKIALYKSYEDQSL